MAGMSGLASDAESFEAFLPREPHAVALGIAALLARAPVAKAPLAFATPTPTPFGWFDPVPPNPTPTPLPASYQGCHRWRYALRWERPSRLAILKNVLGNSVTTYSDYTAPGTGLQTDWPDPIDYSLTWRWKNPSSTTIGLWSHDCDDSTSGAPACKGAGAYPDIEGEHPGIYYSKGTWDWPDPGPNSDLPSIYSSTYPPLYHPNDPTTKSRMYEDAAIPPTVFVAAPYETAGTYDGWAWTLNYGYGAAPLNDIVYGPDPGPPLPVMDLTPLGDSIPGQTGRPLAFTMAQTLGGGSIGAEPSPGVDSTPLRNLNQPTWTTSIPHDVVGNTKEKVNWGLMTFTSPKTDTNTASYTTVVPVASSDLGDVTVIEAALRLKLHTDAPWPGLSVGANTPTKDAIAQADASLTTTWGGDPKKRCDRAYGVILCTDGQSNLGNTGSPLNKSWDSTATPCASDTGGTAFIHFPPGAAEAMYLDAHHDTTSAGNAIVRARTFAIGLSTDISRCELNRIAYRGRTDANAPEKDGGFVLYDPVDSPNGDVRLPHIDPTPETDGTATPTDESGASLPASSGGKNRFGPDQATPDNADYAFFASDAQTLEDSFLAIVRSSASGDYTTSSPVSGGAVALGNTVILPSTKYPSWEGHLRALDTTNPASIVQLWDAGNVLTNPVSGQPTPQTRSLYTWDPSHSNALIAITTANAGLIDGLCGTCGITSAVVDFIRGNNGKELNQKRKWLLGPAINSTPAIVGPPQIYYQTGNVAPHKSFETLYTARRALAWVGADDGLVHAFDLADGSEVIGLLPPNLIKNQTKLYANYLTGKKTETGQEPETADHIWGVANSFRFADIWFPGPKTYKTVGFVTTGPGGDLVAAIDITHPYGNLLGTPAVPGPGAVPKDKNFDPLKPVEILWTKGSSDYPGLNLSWSVPAIAANTNTTSLMTFGAGINPNSLYNNGQKDANVFVVDPRDGTLISSPPVAIAPLASPDPLVGHQTFAHSVFFQTSARGFQPDNIANLSIQVDTNGRANALWADGSHPWSAPKSATLIDLNAAAGDLPQPIYYSPAANGIGTQGCQVYALVSGSLYERSPAVSGWNVNRDAPTVKPPAGSGFPDTLPAFVPNLFIATNPYKITDFAFATTPLGATAPTDMSAYVIKKQIGGETAGIPLQLTDPTYSDGSGPDPVHTRLGIHTQVTSSPLLIIDQSTDVHEALFSVYDPDYGCNGYSYIIIVKFKLASECAAAPAFDTTTVYAAGPGAASGFVVTKDSLFAAKSGVKKSDASLFKVDVPPAALPGAPNFTPRVVEGAEVVPDVIAGPGSYVRPRGFSLRELGLTLLLLAVVIVAAVRLIDLRTKLLVVEKDDPGLGSALEAAARALSRDVMEAGRGGVPPGEAVRPVADNTNAEGGASFTDVSGGSVVVRAGTDQLGLRGVMRTPLLAVRLSRGAGAGVGGESRADRIRVDASSVWLRAGPLSASEGPGRADEPSRRRRKAGSGDAAREAVLPRGGSGGPLGRRPRPRVESLHRGGRRSRDPSRLHRSGGGAPEPARRNGCGPGARGSGDGRPPRRHRLVRRAGARGPVPRLRSRERSAVHEVPASLPGRRRIRRERPVGDRTSRRGRRGIPGGLGARGRGDPEIRVDREGRASIRAGRRAPAPLEFPPLLNAPALGSVPGAGPVGWDPDETRRIPFERVSKEFVLTLPDAESRAPRGAPPRVK